MKKLTGILLVNLGTPDAPEAQAVGRYLRQFLMDPLVLDVPWAIRFPLVNWAIVPKRKHTSAEAYKKVWTEQGSPLLFHTRALALKLQEALEDSHLVCYGMRYGNPSLESVLREMDQESLARIIVVPLYPQSTFSSNVTVVRELIRIKNQIQTPIDVAPNFFLESGFINSFGEKIKKAYQEFSADQLILSFHGLPERHIIKSDKSGNMCLMSSYCCEEFSNGNKNCYRAQCYETARRIAAAAGLSGSQCKVSFQSRLGRDPWIRPFTDYILKEFAAKGIKRLVVACP